MEVNIETPKPNRQSNGHLLITEKSRSIKTDSHSNGHISIFDPNKYMLKLPKQKKVTLPNGQVRFEKTEADYLQLPPVLHGSGRIILTRASSQR
jgi:hypothetical protein